MYEFLQCGIQNFYFLFFKLYILTKITEKYTKKICKKNIGNFIALNEFSYCNFFKVNMDTR